MDLFAIATCLTLASMCCALIAGGDVLLAEEIRDKTGAAIRRSIEGALQPISIRYYIFVVGFSCISTVIVITASGGLQSLQEKQQMMTLAAKSTGPFLLAVILKVLVWDYLMVIKS